MSAIFGALGIADTERAFVQTLGQSVVYDAVGQVLAQWNRDLDAAYSLLVDGTTEDFKFRYKLPGGGYLQRRGGLAQSANIKATGSWDVSLPLDDFGAAVGGDDITLAYMSIQDLNVHLDTIMAQDLNTTRLEILKCMFDNANYTYDDPLHGALTITPFANADAVVYPPVLGADAEATESHMLGTTYLSSAISDTNNPFVTIVDELEEHFGAPTGGSNIITFINQAQTAKVKALTDFDPVDDKFTQPGANTAQLVGLPANVPGRIIGRVSGSWVSEWRYMPADYMFGIHLDAPKPLRMRVDPAYTNIPRGLVLKAKDEKYPLENSHYSHRFGLAVVNRLNGVAIKFVANGVYAVPTGFGH